MRVLVALKKGRKIHCYDLTSKKINKYLQIDAPDVAFRLKMLTDHIVVFSENQANIHLRSNLEFIANIVDSYKLR